MGDSSVRELKPVLVTRDNQERERRVDSDGGPLSGMKIPFADELDGPARITAMVHAVAR